ncbi:uncharacterized protein LOC107767403 [Nicotiana tabacum]|uniref:Uncharacterized protein LOC107767403 n=1 Tax=Nicotiana tabacum TaxID=4097 RepID=A0A1S3XPM9_TOBAC|nr:PREDICTED: uncharacterized protein LOC107767403 [Nicotiana tabacum]
MVRARKIEKYKRMLGYPEYFHNYSKKIWIFWSADYKINVLDDKEQQVLLQISQIRGNISFHITIVYSKCDENQKNVLRDELRSTSNNINDPQRVVGDFNVAISSEEKLGGLPYRIQEGINFLSCLNDCNLQDGGFHGTVFTWKCGKYDPTHTKYFKILNKWVDHDEYLNVIQQSWVEEVHGNPLYILHQKTKIVCSALSRWLKTTFGDIYEEPKKLEKLIKELEEVSITNNTQDIRTKLARTKAEFTSFLILQEKVLRQKSRVKWLDEGDANTAYFHGVFKDRRRKLFILKIKNEEGEWIEGSNDVASAAVQFFQKMFQADIVVEDSQILNVVKKVVTEALDSYAFPLGG